MHEKAPAEAPATYAPKKLTARPPASSFQLAMRAESGQLALYVGAGLSMSPPTGLPKGSDVQSLVQSRASLLGIDALGEEGRPATLEALGDAAAAAGSPALEQLREQAADAVDFVHALPNFAHMAIALLLREGVVEVLSVNWDCAIESAGRDLGFDVNRVVRQGDRSNRPAGPVLDKLNGCASQPATLRITRAEVDVPLGWAVHRVGSVLTDSTVVFIGLGTVGRYVAEGVDRILAEGRSRGTSLVVVDPGVLSGDWTKALGTAAEAAHTKQDAESFLDDMLRAALLLALTKTGERGERIAGGGHPDGPQFASGVKRLASELCEHAAVPVWRWWRDGAAGKSVGHPFVLDKLGQTALAAVGGLVGGSDVAITEWSESLVVELDDFYVETCCWPDASGAEVVGKQSEFLRRRQRGNAYPKDKPVLTVAVGHDGPLPTVDVGAPIWDTGGAATDVFDGPERLRLAWVPGEAYTQGAWSKP